MFSEPVTGFDGSNITFTGEIGANASVATVTAVDASGTTYLVEVNVVPADGDVTITVNPNAAQDLAGNPNPISSSTDDTVTCDFSGPFVSSYLGDGSASFTLVVGTPQDIIFTEALSTAGKNAASAAVLAGVTAGPPPTLSWNGADDTLTLTPAGNDTFFMLDVKADITDLAGNTTTNEVLIKGDQMAPSVLVPFNMSFTASAPNTLVLSEPIDATSRAAVESAMAAFFSANSYTDTYTATWDADGTTLTVITDQSFTTATFPAGAVILTDVAGNITRDGFGNIAPEPIMGAA